MDINTLSAREKKNLFKQLEAEQRQQRKKREAAISGYKSNQDTLITEMLPGLVSFYEHQKEVVKTTIEKFSGLINAKSELYDVKENGQDSHTFTARDGSGSITIGYNIIIGYDGTEPQGVQKVKQFIGSLSAGDAKRKILGDLLDTFMKPDKKGNLNPVRVAELVNKKAEIDNQLFSDGVDIIVAAQFKKRTSPYVRGWKLVRTEGEPDKKITFNISAA